MRRLCLLLLGLTCVATAYSVDVTTYKEGLYLVTEAIIPADGWAQKGWRALRELGRYNDWILRGLDGKDPVSAQYWEQYKQVAYLPPSGFELIYDLNMGWPFGSKGNLLNFQVDWSEINDLRLNLKLINSGIVVEETIISVAAEWNEAQRQVFRLRVRIHFGALIEPFIDRTKYDPHLNDVVKTLVRNLQEYSAKL